MLRVDTMKYEIIVNDVTLITTTNWMLAESTFCFYCQNAGLFGIKEIYMITYCEETGEPIEMKGGAI